MEPHEFQGTIGPTWREATPWWPEPERAPAGSPNVVLFVLDDVGFAQLGCYGSDLRTPNIDALAAGGLRYRRFHTTALCSPTRACLLTGRNHHSVGMGRITDLARGFPGYSGRIPKSAGFLSETLQANHYATFAVGKWHLTPDEEAHLAASRKRWPLGRGFDRFYGFFHGETHQYEPELVHDNHFVDPPGSYDEGYHLTEDLADHAIEYVTDLRAVDPEKPFFLYFATGACHSPHHAPPEWIEREKGRFDAGWDVWREQTFARQQELGIIPEGTVLTDRPSWVPAWDDVPADEKPLAARFMECFAAYLSHTDHQIGRVLNFLRTLDELDNTIVVLVSDNGASSEGGKHGSINDVRLWNQIPAGVPEMAARIDEIGGPTIHNNYPWGWTMAGCTPLRRWKRETHEGGITDPCIVRWPQGITTPGEIRDQFAHAIDVAPTILELLGVDPPQTIDGVDQRPLDGTSFAYTFTDADAPPRHTTQYFEMLGCRAIYENGWKAVTFKPMGRMYREEDDPDLPFDQDEWELFNTADDFSESRNLAAREPAKLAELQARWWAEAERNQVLPLDNRAGMAMMEPPPTGIPDRTRFVYRPGGHLVPEFVAVDVKRRSHRIRATVDLPDDGIANGAADGVILAMGGILGGFSLFVQDGRLQYVHNHVGRTETHLTGADPLTPGAHTLEFAYRCDDPWAGGLGTLLVDGDAVAETEIPRFTAVKWSLTGAGLTCGYDGPSAVTPRYKTPNRFRANLSEVVVEVAPHGLHQDGWEDLQRERARLADLEAEAALTAD